MDQEILSSFPILIFMVGGFFLLCALGAEHLLIVVVLLGEEEGGVFLLVLVVFGLGGSVGAAFLVFWQFVGKDVNLFEDVLPLCFCCSSVLLDYCRHILSGALSY